MSNGEPWEFFGRIEDLENITKGLEATKTRARDNSLVGILAFGFAFLAFNKSAPHRARASKDELMPLLKKTRLSQPMLDALEQMMLIVCDTLDQQD